MYRINDSMTPNFSNRSIRRNEESLYRFLYVAESLQFNYEQIFHLCQKQSRQIARVKAALKPGRRI